MFVPRELRSEAVCLAAVKEDGFALRYVPEELKSEELCLAAVRQNGDALQFVPMELRGAVAAALEQESPQDAA
jgi:hypothetical protein